MTYAQAWTAANDSDFQGRCMAGLWDIASALVRGDAITKADSTPLNTEDGINFALKVLRSQQVISIQQVTIQILRDPAIAANPSAASDGNIQYMIKENWFDMASIG